MEKLYEESKKAAFEYYKENKNLNVIYYSTNDKNLQMKLVKWQQEFHEIIMKEERKLMKNENLQNIYQEQELDKKNSKNKHPTTKFVGSKASNMNILKSSKQFSISETKKHSFLLGNNISSQLHLAFGSKLKGVLEEEFLDLDEMVEMDYPKEHNPEISNMLLKELGSLLTDNREGKYKKSDSKTRMKNDDFRLLLCLLRLKKADTQEVVPYFSQYKFDLRDLYTTQVDPEEDELENLDELLSLVESEQN